MKIHALLIAATILILTTPSPRAQIIAIQSANLPVPNHSGFTANLTLGWKFTVGGSSISVTELGYFDSSGNGLAESHQVGIWNSTGTLLTDATFLAGTGATLLNSYRFMDVSPVTLEANQSYFIGGWSSGNADPIISGSLTEVIVSEIQFDSHSYNPDGGFLSPSTTYGNSGFGNFGPNFSFSEVTPVPEPREYAMVTGLALVVFIAIRNRIARQRTREASA
jgi:hypothetical protein